MQHASSAVLWPMKECVISSYWELLVWQSRRHWASLISAGPMMNERRGTKSPGFVCTSLHNNSFDSAYLTQRFHSGPEGDLFAQAFLRRLSFGWPCRLLAKWRS